MTILVVEDHVALRETLAHLVKNQGDAIVVLEAGTLDEARELLPLADAVLSDGSFPTQRRQFLEPAGVSDTNWAPVRMDCEKAKVPFVLLAGDLALVGKIRQQGGLAFEKPSGALKAVREAVRAAELAMLERMYAKP
jgi:DNA-binding NarL/FixJ family response regulator